MLHNQLDMFVLEKKLLEIRCENDKTSFLIHVFHSRARLVTLSSKNSSVHQCWTFLFKLCLECIFFQGRTEFTITWDELYQAYQDAAVWANSSVQLRGVLLDNSTPPPFKGNCPPQLGGLRCVCCTR